MSAAERGLVIGAFAGAPIVVEQSILLLVFYVLGQALLDGGAGAVPSALLFLAAILLTVLIHECGHAGLAAALGLRSKRIVLTFFGGHVEFLEAPRARWQEIAVSAAGPLANLACAALVPIVLSAAAAPIGWPDRIHPFALTFVDTFFYVSLMLGLFNLLPGLPLDGGRMLRALLAYWVTWPRASLITAWIGLAIAGALAAFALTRQMWWTLFIAALLALAALAEIRRALRIQSSATSNA